jgi:transcriptional regulator of acetoin/glycerol metabolism
VLRTACAMLDAHEEMVEWHHLSDDFLEELQSADRFATPTTPERPPQNLDELSQSAIQQALESCRGNMSHAARTLGISRQTLYRKLALRKERLAAPDVQHSARGLLSGR